MFIYLLSSLSSERQWSTSSKLCLYSARQPGTEREQRGGLEAPQPPWCRTTSGPPCAWLWAWWERALCTQLQTAGTWTRCWLTSARGRWKEGQNEGRPGEGWSSVSVWRWEVNVWGTERNQSGYRGGRHCELSTILQRSSCGYEWLLSNIAVLVSTWKTQPTAVQSCYCILHVWQSSHFLLLCWSGFNKISLLLLIWNLISMKKVTDDEWWCMWTVIMTRDALSVFLYSRL